MLLDWTVSVGSDTRVWDGTKTLSFSDIQLGDRVHVSGTKTSSTMIAASDVIFQTTKPDLRPAQVNGPVSGLSGTCSTNLTFTVDGTKVTADSTTQFVAGTCAQMVNGVTVHVEGSRQTDGSVKASRIEIHAGTERQDLSGTIAGLGGTCPAITFTLGSTNVTTSASTNFANTTCAALANHDTVNVQGLRQTNGNILADRVEKRK
jgi:hypothetical protein